MVFLFFFMTISLLIYGVLLTGSEKRGRVKKRLTAFVTGEQQQPEEVRNIERQHTLYKRFIKPIFLDFKRGFKKRMPGEKEARIEKKLQMAGSPMGMSPVDFRLLQTALFLVIPLLFGGYAVLLNAGNALIPLFAVMGLLIALAAPHLYLKQKTKGRNKKALKELPDILDLLTVSLEAGLGFDSAISKVVSKKDGVIVNEFHRCLEEMRLGKTRREALSGIRDRLGVDEVRSFISSILQAEKLGIGMVQVLRVQSGEVREQRKQRAEEEAMKAPIKMLFPLVIFIFPSLFIVLLGPALIQFMEAFKK